MTRLILLVTLIGTCLSQESLVGARQGEKKEASQKTQPYWTAKIVEASQPPTANIDQRYGYGLQSVPRANSKWLLIAVELKHSTKEGEEKGGQSAVFVDSIGVSGDSAEPNYSPTALSHGWERSLVYVEDFPSIHKITIEVTACGESIISPLGREKKLALIVTDDCATTFRFLFMVADGAKQFSFHLSKDYSVPVTIQK